MVTPWQENLVKSYGMRMCWMGHFASYYYIYVDRGTVEPQHRGNCRFHCGWLSGTHSPTVRVSPYPVRLSATRSCQCSGNFDWRAPVSQGEKAYILQWSTLKFDSSVGPSHQMLAKQEGISFSDRCCTRCSSQIFEGPDRCSVSEA